MHNTMPARLGLLVTAIFAGRRVRRPVVEMLASLLVAKLLELTALVATIAAVLPLMGPVVGANHSGGTRAFGNTALAGFAVVAVLGLLLVLLAADGAPSGATGCDGVTARPGWWGSSRR